MRKIVSAVALVSVSLMLLGCSSGSTGGSEVAAGDVVTGGTAVGDTNGGGVLPEPAPEAEGFDLISSCDEVEGVLSLYIDGLVQAADNGVSEYGASCTWTMREGETDWANAREVSFGAEPVAPGEPAPDVAALANIDSNITALDAEWIEAEGGVAYSMKLGSDIKGGVITTVWTPEYQVTIGGGNWANQVSLDEHAALEAVRGALG